MPDITYTGPLVSSLEQWPSWNEAGLASASLRCAVLEGGVTRDYALASSAQAELCKPAGGPAQWVCVLTEVQVGGGGVGEIKERWLGCALPQFVCPAHSAATAHCTSTL